MSADDIEGRLRGSGLVAADLGDVDADLLGELLLRQSLFLAQRCQCRGSSRSNDG